MNKKNDLILGIVLIAASVAVCFRYIHLMDELEKGSDSVFFLRFAFIIFSLILAGAGVKKIIGFTGKNKENNVEKDEDI